MPLYLGEVVNQFVDKLIYSSFIEKIVSNTVYTSFAITIFVVIVIAILLRDIVKKNAARLYLGCGFWIFFVTTMILFLHNKILNREIKQENLVGGYDKLFGAGFSGILSDGDTLIDDSIVHVPINTDFI